jgi:hypothetical protein
MSQDLKLIAIAFLAIVVCTPGATYAKDAPCKQLWKVHNREIVKGLCVRHDPEADPEVMAKKKKAAEEAKKANSTPLVPIYSCSNGAPVTPDHQCRCPAGQAEGKNGLCARVVQGQNPSTPPLSECPRGQVKMRSGLCRFAVECPAGSIANDIGKCVPTNIFMVQGHHPCPSGLVLTRNGTCVSGVSRWR